MSIVPEPIIPFPSFGPGRPSSEERMYRASEQASLLEHLRVNHPELFSLKVTLDDPGVRCMKNKFNIDLTKEDDNLIAILLRSHANLICNGRPVGTPGWEPANYMYEVVKDALDKLNLDFAAANRLGATWNLSHEYTDDTNKHAAISFLGQAINLLVNSKAAEQAAAAETARRMAESAAARRKQMPSGYNRLLAIERELRMGKPQTLDMRQSDGRIRQFMLMGKPADAERLVAIRMADAEAEIARRMAETDLLGLHSASAAAKPEEIDLLDMNAIRKKEIADDLAGLAGHFGGASRTRKHKQRKHRKARKSRKHSRK